MASAPNPNGRETEAMGDLPPALAENPVGLPPGKYVLVGWDMDTTGRRLIDEICQIAAYTPNKSYAQFIMPYGDLNPCARRRYNVRILTVGRYRMLKDTNTHKILKTKSEVSALNGFLDWLEKEKGDASVILIYHEPRRLYPTMLLQAINRYNLLDRFKSIVSGFTDGFALAFEKCNAVALKQSVSLRVLAGALLNSECKFNTALERATAAFKLVEHFSKGELQEVGEGGEGPSSSTDMIELAREWARPVYTELEALDNLKCLLERQNTYRLVFAPLMRTSRVERRHYTQLRRLLADAGLLQEQIKDAWKQEKRAGVAKLLTPLLDSGKEEDVNELVEIFDCFFDPAKKAIGPKPRTSRPIRVGVRQSAAAGGGELSSDSQHSSQHNSPNSDLATAAGPSARN